MILAVMSLTLSSCGDDNDEPGGNTDSIIGTWSCDESQNVYNDVLSDMWKELYHYIQFRKDGTCIAVDYAIYTDEWADYFGKNEDIRVNKGSYAINGNQLLISDDDGNTQVTFKINGNKMVLTSSLVVEHYTRVSDSVIERFLH